MPITSLPQPPLRTDPSNFAVRGDAFLAALPVFATQATALEANVNTKETSVNNSAVAASGSQTAASNSATAASGSASSASTQASNASSSATAASNSATAASNSATAASGSVTSASTQASNASSSATAASNSATAASGSASSASTQASNASSSATAGSNSATASASSATASQNSANSANNSAAAANASASSVAAPLWVSGTTYAINDVRRSAINGFPYRRLTVGTGTVDPSTDTVNWASVTQLIETGGTGATSAAAARTNLGLGNVSNTSDAAKFTNAALTGLPTAPTPARFDRSTQIATMAAVGAEQGSYAGQLALNASQTITAASGGSEINASGTITLTLPVGAAVPVGAAFIVNNSGTGIVTIVPTGSDVLKRIDAVAGNITLFAGDATTIVFAGGTIFNARVFVAGINAVVSTAQASADNLRVEKSITLPNGTDLNNVVTSGFYRVLASALNLPTPNSIDSQLIVSRGLDTITQMLTRYGDTVTFVRSGTPAQVGGAGVYLAWTQLSSIAAVETLSNKTLTNPAYSSQTLVDAATVAWNMDLGSIAQVVVAGNRTLANPTNLKVGTVVLSIIQDGVGGRAITFGTAYKHSGGAAPVLSTVAGARDVLSYFCDGSQLYGGISVRGAA